MSSNTSPTGRQIVNIDDIIACLKENLCYKEIGRRLGVPPSVIGRIVRHHRLSSIDGRSRRHYDPALVSRNDDILSMHKAGNNAAEIGVKHNLTRERVRQIIGMMGGRAARDTVKQRRLILAQLAISHISQGISRHEIAEKCQVSIEEINDLYSVATRYGGRHIPGLRDAIKAGNEKRRLIAKDEADKKKQISDRIQVAFVLRGLSAKDASLKMGISYLSAHHLSTGQRSVTDKELKSLSSILRVDPEWIVNGEPHQKDIPPSLTVADVKMDDRVLVHGIKAVIDSRRLAKTREGAESIIRLKLGIHPATWRRMMRGQVSIRRHFEQIVLFLNTNENEIRTAGFTRMTRSTKPSRLSRISKSTTGTSAEEDPSLG